MLGPLVWGFSEDYLVLGMVLWNAVGSLTGPKAPVWVLLEWVSSVGPVDLL